ncbi:MAG: hypothetical protein HYY37_04250 [Candidatus Aenigmarchaeota archaeon]|nr:hypothetical protein [Candidatus Aenigmarchaeota archaeon]
MLQPLDMTLDVREYSLTYPQVGTITQGAYRAGYASQLTKLPRMPYDKVMQQLPAGYAISSAGMERAIQKALEDAGIDPREDIVFRDLFSPGGLSAQRRAYPFQWTTTGLRVPKGWDDKHDRTKYRRTGKKFWPRIVLEGDREVAELLIPGSGIVTAWYEPLGIPQETAAPARHERLFEFSRDVPPQETTAPPLTHEPYTTHFEFHPATAGKDIAVGRSGVWDIDRRRRCLLVDAHYRRIGDAPFNSAYRLAENTIVPPVFERSA